MASLVHTTCDGLGCRECEDGYVLCACNRDRAQEEHHIDGEGHVCDSCATRYYERQPVESLTDEQLAFLEYTPAEQDERDEAAFLEAQSDTSHPVEVSA